MNNLSTITNNNDIVKIYDYTQLTDKNFTEIKKEFENVKIPCLENFLNTKQLDFFKNNFNIKTSAIKPGEKGYKEWKEKFKKLNDKNILERIEKNEENKDVKKLLKEIDDKVFNLIKKLKYNVVSYKKIYRNTFTEKENLHFDIFNPPKNNNGLLRVFINIDDDYRIWRNSVNIYEFVNKNFKKIRKTSKKEKIRIDTNRGPNNDNLTNFIMKYILHSKFNEKCDEIFNDQINYPKIETKFAPGTAWICDSIQSSHQIYHGRKCINYDFIIDKKSYLSENNIYSNKIKPFIKKLNN